MREVDIVDWDPTPLTQSNSHLVALKGRWSAIDINLARRYGHALPPRWRPNSKVSHSGVTPKSGWSHGRISVSMTAVSGGESEVHTLSPHINGTQLLNLLRLLPLSFTLVTFFWSRTRVTLRQPEKSWCVTGGTRAWAMRNLVNWHCPYFSAPIININCSEKWISAFPSFYRGTVPMFTYY